MAWRNNNIVAIVTGANSGIGYRTCEILCEEGYHVILACRSETKAKIAVANILSGNAFARAEYMIVDFTKLRSVKAFADKFIATGKPLHILINNIGALDPINERRESADGHELLMATNHLGSFLLTRLLVDKMQQTGSASMNTRILFLNSFGHDHKTGSNLLMRLKDIDLEDFHLNKEGAYSANQAYKNSKAAGMMCALKLAQHLKGSYVTVNMVCPGFVPGTEAFNKMTSFRRGVVQFFGSVMMPCKLAFTVDEAAQFVVKLATDPGLEGKTGNYYQTKAAGPTTPSAESRNKDKQDVVWDLSTRAVLQAVPGLRLKPM